MALQAIKGGLPFPAWPTTVATAPNLTSSVLDAAGEEIANIQVASAAKSIRKIRFFTGTVTTGDTVTGSIETVDASGDPSGTLWATDTSGTVAVAGTDDNVWKEITLTADATVAVGDVFAIVLTNGGGGGNMQIAFYPDMVSHQPYSDAFLTGAWVKTAGGQYVIVVEYSDGTFEPVFGMTGVGGPINTNSTFNSGATTNRRGNIFQVPFPTRAKGCWVWVDADGDYTVKLYDADGSTVLATTATINNAQRGATTAGLSFHPFLTTANLSKDTNYRLAIVPSTTTNLIAYDFDVPAAGMLDMFSGGQNCHRSVYTSGAWVQTTTARAYLGVILDAFDDAVGGGSSGGGPLLNGRLIQ